MKFRAAAILSATIVGLAMLGTLSPASAAAPTSGTVGVTLVPDDFGAAKPGQPLKLSLTLDDSIGQGIAAGTATVTVNRTPMGSRSGLANWLSGTTKGSAASSRVAKISTPQVLAGERRVIDISVPSKSLKFGAAGVYAVGISITSGDLAVGSSRTAVAWKSSSANPVPVVVAAPLTIPATSTDFISSKDLETDTAPDGILTQQLEDLANSEVAIGIDPRIIASIRVLGRSAPQSAKDWLVALESVSNETFPLAWADSDLTVALQSGSRVPPGVKPLDYAIDPDQFATPTDVPSSTPTDVPTPDPTATIDPNEPPLPSSTADLEQFPYTVPKLAWPAANSVTKNDVTKLAAAGDSALILSSTNVKLSSDFAGDAASVGASSVAISDEVLSGYFADAVQLTGRAESNAALANLTVSLDQISASSAGRAPTYFLTLPRNWTDDNLQLNRALAGVYSRPWVAQSGLVNLLAAKKSTATIINKPQSATRVGLVRAMLVSEGRERRFATIVEVPQALTSSRRLMLLSLLSNEWLDNPSGWTTAARGYLTDSRKIVNSVQVVDSSDVTFLGASGLLPITISNDYSQPVTIYLTLSPQTTLLSVDPKYARLKVEIDANSQRQAKIPVQSLSNGTVGVDVTLSSKSNREIGASKTVNVIVHADWETVGTFVFGALVIAIFALGIFRNIRKRRRARRE